MQAPREATALAFTAVGTTPTENLRLHQYTLNTPDHGQVLVEMVAAPINPQDIMVLLGKYPVKPVHKTPTDGSMIPGYDGVCRVLEVGPSVTGIEIGDFAIPAAHGLGTWRSHAVVPSTSLLRLPPSIRPELAAILRMGVAPGYLLLEDMATLRPGDWIIQNAASSVIAQMVSQFAKLRGVHTISVVRDRGSSAENESLKKRLAENGSNESLVLTESELANTSDFGSRRIVLALDCVFGQSGAELARVVSPGATFVNYGGLGQDAGNGLTLTQQMIFWKQITFKNFRLSQCLASRSPEQVKDLLLWFASLVQQGQLRAPDLKPVQ